MRHVIRHRLAARITWARLPAGARERGSRACHAALARARARERMRAGARSGRQVRDIGRPTAWGSCQESRRLERFRDHDVDEAALIGRRGGALQQARPRARWQKALPRVRGPVRSVWRQGLQGRFAPWTG